MNWGGVGVATRWRTWLALWAALVVTPAAAQSTTNLYTSSDLVVKYPVEGTAIFLAVVFISSIVEFIIGYLLEVENDYFRLVFGSVKEETIVVSIIAMFIGFAKSFGALDSQWVAMLNYGVLSLFFMVLFFVIIIGACVISLRHETNKWIRFEGARIDVDPKLNRKELIFKLCRDRFRESVVASDLVYDPKLLFSEYMRRMERFTVAAITDLSWKSWVVLAFVIVINGVRARITTGDNSQDVTALTKDARSINVGSYIGFVGYGGVILYGMCQWQIYRRLRGLASAPVVKIDNRTNQIDLLSSRVHLFFGKFETTTEIFQCTILVLEWYLSIFVLGMAYEIGQTYPWYYGILIFFFSVLPLLLLIANFPWTVTMVTMLAGLGSDLNVEEVRGMIAALADEKDALGAASKTVAQASASLATLAPLQADDEWNGERITLHQTAKNKLLDHTTPSLKFATLHPNAPVRKDFDTQRRRGAFDDALSQSMLPANDRRVTRFGARTVEAETGRVRDPFDLEEEFGLPPNSVHRQYQQPGAGSFHQSSFADPPPARPNFSTMNNSELPMGTWIDSNVTRLSNTRWDARFDTL